MNEITLTGRLVCAGEREAAIVRQCLDEHVALTRAEPGCLRFRVEPTADPLVWTVDERFVDQVAFDAHQNRVAGSAWGRRTAGVLRDYVITRGESEPGGGPQVNPSSKTP